MNIGPLWDLITAKILWQYWQSWPYSPVNHRVLPIFSRHSLLVGYVILFYNTHVLPTVLNVLEITQLYVQKGPKIVLTILTQPEPDSIVLQFKTMGST